LLAEVLRLGAGAILIAAAITKLASPATSRAALTTFGVAGGRSQAVAWAALIATELVLGVAVAAGIDLAAWLAAVLMAGFSGAMASAIFRGRAGAPCACFGARSTVGWVAVARNGLLAAAFAALPLLPQDELSTDEWLGIGLGVAVIAIACLGVVVLALAREVGMLRLRLGPSSALEMEGEGPGLGSRVGLAERFAPGPSTELALAVFTSEGCHVCAGLRPAVDSLAGDPFVAVETFDEHADASVWRALSIPGSPYAVVLDPAGTVLAKGTFNNLDQLEGLLGTGERRRAERLAAEAPRVG
jgi:hypothetical protein